MPGHNFGSFVFTPVVKALQERHGSRRQYEKLERAAGSPDRLGEDERSFIAGRDSFYMASVGATGWPYIQHRGGPKGFLKVIDDRTLALADFLGTNNTSAPAISHGRSRGDDPRGLPPAGPPENPGTRRHPRGRRRRRAGSSASATGYKAVIERVFVIHLEAFDWNCPQHITPRYTAEEIQTSSAR